jgi:hypothetical protein
VPASLLDLGNHDTTTVLGTNHYAMRCERMKKSNRGKVVSPKKHKRRRASDSETVPRCGCAFAPPNFVDGELETIRPVVGNRNLPGRKLD